LKEKDMGEERSSFWRKKKVFITGCTGLLGSWLTKDFLGLGRTVVGLIRDTVPKSNLWVRNSQEPSIHEILNIVWGGVEDYSLLERTLNEYEIDTVFHLAAQTIVGTANRNPLSTFETNIRGTWNLLEACRRSPLVERIIVASSDKAYGEQDKLPYREATPLEGRFPYDVAKSCADLISQSFYHSFNLPVCIIRCGNLFGGGDLNFNRLIPGVIEAVLFNERPVIRSDGKPIRDYLYVKDAVNGFLLVTEKMAELNLYGEAFNFSNEVQKTVLEIAHMILTLMKATHLKPIILGEAKMEISQQYLSCEKARKILGWKPNFTLEEGFKETIDWYKDFFRREQHIPKIR